MTGIRGNRSKPLGSRPIQGTAIEYEILGSRAVGEADPDVRTPAARYLVLTELFLPTKGGTAVWFDEVYRRLGGKGIHVVTADVPGAAEHDRDHPNTVHRVKLRRHWWLRPESVAMYARLLVRALSVAWGNRFDAVHAGRVLPEGLVGLLVARLIRRPLVVYAHGEEITTWRQPGKLRVMTYVFRHADRVIANSEFTRAELLKLGAPEGRISMIYPGVDVQRFRPGLDHGDLKAGLGLQTGQRLILCVGRLSRRKGFDQVLRALPELLARRLDVHCALIGIGEDRDYLGALAAELAVAGRVHFLGHVASEDLPRWYNAADVFAMPNREIDGDNEGFGMVFIEAAACAKPVVAGRDGGTAAAVVHEETGLRVDGKHLTEVVGALWAILHEPALAERMGQAGYRRALGEFSWERVAEKTLRIGS